MSDKYKGTMVSDESIKKNPGLNRGVTKYLTKAGRFLIDKFGSDGESENNPPIGKPVIRKKKAGKMVKKKSYAAGKMVKKKMMSKGKLVGGQAKLDKNSDGKISGEDFKMMYGGGMTKKKMMAGGGVKKKMMAKGKMVKGGATGGKKKAKVRGAGIARKGVRPAKMR